MAAALRHAGRRRARPSGSRGRFFRGSEGSGIPQVIARCIEAPASLGARLLTLRILLGKIVVSFLAILGGFTIGREGPTVQIGAALMFNLRRLYPRSNALIERQLVLAGAAAGCRRRSIRRSRVSCSPSRNSRAASKRARAAC